MKIFFLIVVILSNSFFLNAQNSEKTEKYDAIKHNPWSLIIYRPDNSAQINEIRCFLTIKDALTGEDVTYKKAKANYAWISEPKRAFEYQKSYFLSGGMAMHLLLKPGKYAITVKTPVKEQLGFKISEKNEAKDWESNTFYYNTENPLKVIFVSPTANENGFYNGGWWIDYKAPQYWKVTKPKI